MKACIFLLISFCSLCFYSCGDHREDEPKFYITNKTNELVYLVMYNNGKAISNQKHRVGERVTSGGGGILSVDSLKFRKNDTTKFVMYKPYRHDVIAYDSTVSRNIFNIDNWEKKPVNDFYYTFLEEDFA